MRTLQDYINIYREIATNQNVTGDSVEILVQLLANASYISEIENLSYVQEASLESATLDNSKIQHCMNNMYSVYRGSCPRVLIKFKPTKYFKFNMFDEIISSNNFKIYYIGYYGEGSSEESYEKCDEDRVPILDGFTYGPKIINPATTDNDVYIIVGILVSEVVNKTWTLSSTNNYYVDAVDTNLSNDLIVRMNTGVSGTYVNQGVTRSFSNHIINRSIFDLTTTDYSSRLYIAELLNNEENEINSNTTLSATYFKLCSLSDFNESELKKISLKGSELVSFGTFASDRGYSELSKGLVYIDEISRDNVGTLHYKANRDRYVNSIIRSNSDLGTMLEEYYPEKVKSTNVKFIKDNINENIIIYYIPKVSTNSLTLLERSEFLESRLPYFLLPTIDQVFIKKGIEYKVELSIKAEISNSDTTDLSTSITSILDNYSGKFNIDLETRKSEIKSLITKISCIYNIEEDDFNFVYKDSSGNVVNYSDIDLEKSYFDIDFEIRTIVKS